MRLEVYLNARGERRFVGLLEERGGDILFEYDKRFLDSGIELSPFLLPLRPGVASDPKRTFDGLFGVFNDSCPTAGGCSCWTACCGAAALPNRPERIRRTSRFSRPTADTLLQPPSKRPQNPHRVRTVVPSMFQTQPGKTALMSPIRPKPPG